MYVVFTKEELIYALMPVFDLVWNQDPESVPFRIPVDPKALGIPVSYNYYCILLQNFEVIFFQDYFDVIKNPIDLSTIKMKLEDGEYKTAWEVRTYIHSYICT